MHRYLTTYWVLSISVVLIMAGGSGWAASPNLVEGAFDEWPGGLPVGWTVEGEASRFAQETGGAFAGEACLEVRSGEAETKLVSEPAPVEAGQLLAFTAWSSPQGSLPLLRFTGVEGDSEIPLTAGVGYLPSGWSYQLAVPVRAPAGATAVSVVIEASAKATQPRQWDNLALWPVPEPEYTFEGCAGMFRNDLLDYVLLQLPGHGAAQPVLPPARQPGNTVYVRVLSDQVGNFFWKGQDEVNLLVRVLHFSGQEETAEVSFRLESWLGEDGGEGTFSVLLPPSGAGEYRLALPQITEIGHYTLWGQVTIDGQQITDFDGRFALANPLTRRDVPPEQSPFGASTGVNGYWPRSSRIIELARLAGVKHRRFVLYPSEPQSANFAAGKYYHLSFDRDAEMAQEFQQAGIDSLALTGWYLSAAPDLHGRVVAEMAKEYGPHFRTWSLMCEPEQFLQRPDYNAETLFENLKGGYLALKRENPELEVFSTSWAGHPHWFLKGYEWGLGSYQDGVVMHSYTENYELVELFREIMERYGEGDKEMIIGESGLGAVIQRHGLAFRREQEVMQAASVVRWFTRLLSEQPSIRWINWFTLSSIYSDEASYGGHGLCIPEDLEPRPGLMAYMVLTDTIGLDPQPVGASVKDRTRAYMFATEEGPVGVIWTDGPKAEVTFACDSDEVRLSDIMGRPLEPVVMNEGRFTLTLDRTPLYVRGGEEVQVTEVKVVGGGEPEPPPPPTQLAPEPVQAHNLSFQPGLVGEALSLEPGLILAYPVAGRLDPLRGTVEVWMHAENISTLGDMQGLHLVNVTHAPDWAAGERGLSLGIYVYPYSVSVGVIYGRQAGWGRGSALFDEPLADGWHHLAFTWDYWAGECCLYLDGSLVDTGELPINHVPWSVPASNKLWIRGVDSSFAAGRGGDRPPFRAALDELMIFGRVKSAPEISADYQRGLEGKAIATGGCLFYDPQRM